MKRFIGIVALFVFALSACSPATPSLVTNSQIFISPTSIPTIGSPPEATMPPSTPFPTFTPPPTHDPEAERINLLFLGGDYREHRAGTGFGDKTDVMILVQIVMDTPARVTMIQFPRNLYHPVEAMDDAWLFHIWGREGYPGLHYYFQQVFDIDLHGIFYINMDHFVSLVDVLGGMWIGASDFDSEFADGETTIAYLRDNENNWGCPEYDCGDRQMRMLFQIAENVKNLYKEKPLDTLMKMWNSYSRMVKTDLSDLEQVRYLFSIGLLLATRDYSLDMLKLTKSGYIEYGDTPLEVRGWIIPDLGDLQWWISFVLGG